MLPTGEPYVHGTTRIPVPGVPWPHPRDNDLSHISTHKYHTQRYYKPDGVPDDASMSQWKLIDERHKSHQEMVEEPPIYQEPKPEDLHDDLRKPLGGVYAPATPEQKRAERERIALDMAQRDGLSSHQMAILMQWMVKGGDLPTFPTEPPPPVQRGHPGGIPAKRFDTNYVNLHPHRPARPEYIHVPHLSLIHI